VTSIAAYAYPDAEWTRGNNLERNADAIMRQNGKTAFVELETGTMPLDRIREKWETSYAGCTDSLLVVTLDERFLGDAASRSKDVLGRVYEYFLGKFANAEGKGGGEFYTPQSVVKLLVEMIEPYKGRIYDPCCGSGGMFVSSEKFVLAHGGRVGDLSIYGQESNNTTWRLCKMNLAIRGIDGNIGPHNADTFHNDVHKDLKADFILANPPFNISDWGGERLRDDARWKFGAPPVGNANYAWVQHMVHHLAPSGIAGFVLANGSMSSNQSGEGEIRRQLVEKDLVDCMIALPGQLFYTTQIPVCLWFLARNKKNGKFRDRRGSTLIIDARKLGSLDDIVALDDVLDWERNVTVAHSHGRLMQVPFQKPLGWAKGGEPR